LVGFPVLDRTLLCLLTAGAAYFAATEVSAVKGRSRRTLGGAIKRTILSNSSSFMIGLKADLSYIVAGSSSLMASLRKKSL